jgi:hypothetical protein
MDLPARAAAVLAVVAAAVLARPAVADPPPVTWVAAPRAAAPAPVVDPGSEVVLRALSLLGVDYRYGGNTPETGLDCSGLVRLVFHDALGLPLPRRSEEISRVGGPIRRAELQPGDLVFFNTLRRAFSHVGIYIGNGQFVHAPSTGGTIRVDRLDRDYWVRRFDGARRLLADDLAGAASFSSLAAGGATVRTAMAAPPAAPIQPLADRRTQATAQAASVPPTRNAPRKAATGASRSTHPGSSGVQPPGPRVASPPGARTTAQAAPTSASPPATVAAAGPPAAVSALFVH